MHRPCVVQLDEFWYICDCVSHVLMKREHFLNLRKFLCVLPPSCAITALISVTRKALLELPTNELPTCLVKGAHALAPLTRRVDIFWPLFCSLELNGCTFTTISLTCLLCLCRKPWNQVVSPSTVFYFLQLSYLF